MKSLFGLVGIVLVVGGIIAGVKGALGPALGMVAIGVAVAATLLKGK